MTIDLKNIRKNTITADEWVELCNIMALAQDMTDEDYEKMPGMKEWVNAVKILMHELKQDPNLQGES
jgi:hypothetical protein